jgi:hypothetical protein
MQPERKPRITQLDDVLSQSFQNLVIADFDSLSPYEILELPEDFLLSNRCTKNKFTEILLQDTKSFQNLSKNLYEKLDFDLLEPKLSPPALLKLPQELLLYDEFTNDKFTKILVRNTKSLQNLSKNLYEKLDFDLLEPKLSPSALLKLPQELLLYDEFTNDKFTKILVRNPKFFHDLPENLYGKIDFRMIMKELPIKTIITLPKTLLSATCPISDLLSLEISPSDLLELPEDLLLSNRCTKKKFTEILLTDLESFQDVPKKLLTKLDSKLMTTEIPAENIFQLPGPVCNQIRSQHFTEMLLQGLYLFKRLPNQFYNKVYFPLVSSKLTGEQILQFFPTELLSEWENEEFSKKFLSSPSDFKHMDDQLLSKLSFTQIADPSTFLNLPDKVTALCPTDRFCKIFFGDTILNQEFLNALLKKKIPNELIHAALVEALECAQASLVEELLPKKRFQKMIQHALSDCTPTTQTRFSRLFDNRWKGIVSNKFQLPKISDYGGDPEQISYANRNTAERSGIIQYQLATSPIFNKKWKSVQKTKIDANKKQWLTPMKNKLNSSPFCQRVLNANEHEFFKELCKYPLPEDNFDERYLHQLVLHFAEYELRGECNPLLQPEDFLEGYFCANFHAPWIDKCFLGISDIVSVVRTEGQSNSVKARKNSHLNPSPNSPPQRKRPGSKVDVMIRTNEQSLSRNVALLHQYYEVLFSEAKPHCGNWEADMLNLQKEMIDGLESLCSLVPERFFPGLAIFGVHSVGLETRLYLMDVTFCDAVDFSCLLKFNFPQKISENCSPILGWVSDASYPRPFKEYGV